MCIVVENSLNVSVLVSQKEEMAHGRKDEKIKEGQNRRPDCSRLSANVIVRRHIIIHHPSLINAKGEVCTQLPPTIHCYNVRTRTRIRAHVRTHACTHGITRARVFYERRECVELVQGIYSKQKKNSNRFRNTQVENVNETIFRRVNSNRSVGEDTDVMSLTGM